MGAGFGPGMCFDLQGVARYASGLAVQNLPRGVPDAQPAPDPAPLVSGNKGRASAGGLAHRPASC